jgi:transcription antitermination factor NusG
LSKEAVVPTPFEPPAPVAKIVVPVVVDPEAALVPGSRVQVKSGPFAGKVGAIVERDVRGAKVSFGLLSARVNLGDLEALAT